jgi:putative heme-binding domain-containing protein
LASSLGAWQDPRSGRALGTLAVLAAGDEYLTAAVLSSVNRGNVADVLSGVFVERQGKPGESRLIVQLLRMAAAFGEDEALVRVMEKATRPSEAGYDAWQAHALAGVLDELDRRRTSPETLRVKSPERLREVLRSIAALVRFAREAVADESADDELRRSAIRLLGRDRDRRKEDVARLARLLDPRAGASLQSAAVERLARLGGSDVPPALLANWRTHSPRLRRDILDALLTRDEWAEALLDEIERGKLAAAEIDATRRQALAARGSTAFRARAQNLLAAVVDPNRAAVVDAHRGVLKLSGDATRGKSLFQKKCASCHRLGGEGHAVGPDLAALSNRSPDALLVALLDPNRAVEDKFRAYQALTIDGRQLVGIVESETASAVTLLAQEGKRETVLRADIEQLQSTGKSLMPEGLENDLSPQDLADVIALVAGVGPPPKEFAGNRPALVAPAPDGTLTLLASTCAIYGPTLVFEAGFHNLGYWSSAEDRAVWTIDVPAAGRYRVTIEYACKNDTAGNHFLIETAEGSLAGVVAGTGDWDDYRQCEAGELPLSAGTQTIVFRAQGPLRGALLDLRGLRLAPVK